MINLNIIRTHVLTITRIASNLTKYVDLSRKGPVGILRNGKLDAFIISAETYDRLVEALEELKSLKEGGPI